METSIWIYHSIITASLVHTFAIPVILAFELVGIQTFWEYPGAAAIANPLVAYAVQGSLST
jgi:hypothetical protein